MAKPATSTASTGYDVPAAAIAHCGGCSDPRRRDWADAGLLRKKPPFQPHDAAETAVLLTLANRTNKNTAPQAWRVVRQNVRELALAGKADIWIVLTKGGQRHESAARAVESAAAAAQVAAALGEPAWVVPVADPIRMAKERFAKLIEREANEGGNVTPLHARGGGKSE
jgi:hypothetical protein